MLHFVVPWPEAPLLSSGLGKFQGLFLNPAEILEPLKNEYFLGVSCGSWEMTLRFIHRCLVSQLLVVAFLHFYTSIIMIDIKIKRQVCVWTRNVTRLKYIFITALVEGNDLDFKKKF